MPEHSPLSVFVLSDYSYFKFLIRNEKYQVYKKFGAFILLLNGLGFLYLSTASVPPFTHLLFISLGIILFFYAVYSFFSKSHDRSYVVLFILTALAWISELGYFSPAVISIVLMIMQILAQHTIFLTINKEGVVLYSFRERKIEWKEIQHLILKDGILTIDLSNDKIIQVHPDFLQPVIVQKGGSLNQVKWTVDEDYPELEKAVNNFFATNGAAGS